MIALVIIGTICIWFSVFFAGCSFILLSTLAIFFSIILSLFTFGYMTYKILEKKGEIK